MREIRYDCDADVLLVTVEQAGDVACHTAPAAVSTKTAMPERPVDPKL